MSLKWSDICFFTNRIKVKKSKAGKIQYVPMNILAIEAFKKLKSMPVHVSNEVFYRINISTSGRNYYKVDKVWKQCCKEAGIAKIRWHDLRHTFASHAAMNKETLPMIGRLLGHANAGSTVRYAHFDDDHVLEAAEQIGAAIERMLCD